MKILCFLCFLLLKINFLFGLPNNPNKKDTSFHYIEIFWNFGKDEIHKQCYLTIDSALNVYKTKKMKSIFVEIYQNENPRVSYSLLNRRKKSIFNYFIQKGIFSENIHIEIISIKGKNIYRKNVKGISDTEIQDKHKNFYPIVFISFLL